MSIIINFCRDLIERKTLLERNIYQNNEENKQSQKQIDEIETTLKELNVEYRLLEEGTLCERMEIKYKDKESIHD